LSSPRTTCCCWASGTRMANSSHLHGQCFKCPSGS